MKNRFMIILTFAIIGIVGLYTAKTANAAEVYDLFVGDINVTSDNCSDIISLENGGKVSYDKDTDTLILDNATITTCHIVNGGFDATPCNLGTTHPSRNKIKIRLIGENTLSGGEYGIYGNNSDIEFEGDGSLNITSYYSGIYTRSDIKVDGPEINFDCEYYAIECNCVTIVRGSVTKSHEDSRANGIREGIKYDPEYWVAIDYRPNGTIGDTYSQFVRKDTDTIPMSRIYDAPEGKIFKCWNTEPDGSGSNVFSNINTSEGMVLYAQWLEHNAHDKQDTDGSLHKGWTGIDSLPNEAGCYYLTSDISIYGTWKVPVGETNLCLNGHSIIQTDSENTDVISIDSNATLNFFDVDGNTGMICHDPYNGYCGRGVMVNGIFTMNGGQITKNAEDYARDNGSGVYVGKTGSFIMNGGMITDNGSDSGMAFGGGVYTAGTFVMNGGTISNNSCGYITSDRGNGGGICISGTGSFTLNDGIIKDNKSGSRSCDILVGGAFNRFGGTIDGNIDVGSDTVKLSFEANKGSGTMYPQYFKKGNPTELIRNTFKRVGYTFGGWNSEPDGKGQSYPETTTFLGVETTSEGIWAKTFYAQWVPIRYTITFNSNDGTGRLAYQGREYDDGVGLLENTFAGNDKCAFIGWNTKPDGSGTSYSDKEKGNLTDVDGTAITLYAQWREHIWEPATSTKPKTCSVCGKTEGSPLASPGSSDSDNSNNTKDKITAKEKAKANLQINSKISGSSKGSKVTVKWGKVSRAEKYEIYAVYCGKAKFTKLAQVGGKVTSYSFSKLKGKKINSKEEVKVYIAVYRKVNGKYKRLAKSNEMHIVGSNSKKYTNVKSIKIDKTKIKLAIGKKYTLKPKTVLWKNSKKMIDHTGTNGFRYASSDPEIVTVNSKGTVNAKKAGKCTVNIYGQNGNPVKVKVVVK